MAMMQLNSRVMGAAALVVLLSVSSAWAAETKGEPRPAPRLPNGQVDLGGNGVWSLPWVKNMGDKLVNGGEVPFLPWTKAMYKYNNDTKQVYDPEGFCLPPGGPRSMATPYPAEIIQQKDRISILFEGGGHVWRQIYMDGRKHPPLDELNPTYFGHSIGHWEGDTLVVDTVGYNERSWVDFSGHMHTEAMHTVERITRPDYDTLHYQVTIDDPEAYSAPWTVAWDIPWHEGQDLAEYICQENNQFLVDLKDDFGEPFFQPTTGAR